MRPDTPVQSHPDLISPPATVDVVGVPLAVIDYEGTLRRMEAMVAERHSGYVCACNVHTVMASREDPELRAALLSRSALNVPDGQPLVWAINALGHSLTDRVYGPELMARACARAASTDHRFYLYGGRDQEALLRLGQNLRRRFPGINIVGAYAPPFRPLSGEERVAIAEEINQAEPDVVWVGIGVPEQEKWMAMMRPQLEAPLLVGVGAAFDFHAGIVPQAPAALQRAGLEWAYRLAHEPRRLWRRYLRYNPRFVAAFGRQLVAHRAAGENSRIPYR
ncbi:MAG: WecB/TagA/CpsF family glycosyltransferase [Solirubrobacterales bacterium]|nr:WecB/TagA/CpsF family glycosyltransferase [Solirubrobacterales bacterium]